MNRQQMTAPFAEEELHTFKGRGNQMMTYIEDETVMDRLDVGYGPGNWQIQVDAVNENVVKVRLGVRESGEWIWNEDFGYPNNTDGETLKQAVSDGIRRCGRYVGIARDLYRKSIDVERPRATASGPTGVQTEPDSGQETTHGDETEEIIGRLSKTGTIRKSRDNKLYQLDARETPDGTHAIGFRLELPDDRDIPQVLAEGPVGEAIYVWTAGKPVELVGAKVTVKGRLYNVKSPGRKSYYRLRVLEIEHPDFKYPADEGTHEPAFDDAEQATIDAALEKAGTAA